VRNNWFVSSREGEKNMDRIRSPRGTFVHFASKALAPRPQFVRTQNLEFSSNRFESLNLTLFYKKPLIFPFYGNSVHDRNKKERVSFL
jgi:hypothetical protein